VEPSGSVTAIGVISIIFGIICIILTPLTMIVWVLTSFDPAWSDLSPHRLPCIIRIIINFLLDIILIVSGIGVLKLESWARALVSIYGWGKIALGTIAFIYTINLLTPNQVHGRFPGILMFAMLFSFFGWFVYPIILLTFLGRPNIREQFIRKLAPSGSGETRGRS